MAKAISSFLTDWYEGRGDLSVSSDVTLTSVQEIIAVETTTGAHEIELPDTTGVLTTKRIWLYDSESNASVNNFTIIPNALDSTTIDSTDSLVVSQDGQVVILELVSTTWTVVNRGDELQVTSVSSAYTVHINDGVIFADTSGGPFTITLLPLADVANKIIRIKKLEGFPAQLTILGDSLETIDNDVAGVVLTGNKGPSIDVFPRIATDWSII